LRKFGISSLNNRDSTHPTKYLVEKHWDLKIYGTQLVYELVHYKAHAEDWTHDGKPHFKMLYKNSNITPVPRYVSTKNWEEKIKNHVPKVVKILQENVSCV
jgi:hypothetical protein